MTFAELDVHPELVGALAKQQITEPTAIQIAALPVLLAGKDAYLNSETGTGKTLAYLLPIFARLDVKQEATQVVIVAPTHELAIQIQRQCCDLAQNAGRPIKAVAAIASAPQRVTRHAPRSRLAPPAPAARLPSAARNTSELSPTAGRMRATGATAATASGRAAPIANIAAEASPAWTGRAA